MCSWQKKTLPNTLLILGDRAQHWVPIPMPTHAHGFWVGMGAMLLFVGGHGCDIIVHEWAWVGIGFVHPCIQLQIGVKLLGCKEYTNPRGEHSPFFFG